MPKSASDIMLSKRTLENAIDYIAILNDIRDASQDKEVPPIEIVLSNTILTDGRSSVSLQEA